MQQRGGTVFPVSTGRDTRKKDVVHFVVFAEEREPAHAWLTENAWVLVEQLDPAAPLKGASPAPPDPVPVRT